MKVSCSLIPTSSCDSHTKGRFGVNDRCCVLVTVDCSVPMRDRNMTLAAKGLPALPLLQSPVLARPITSALGVWRAHLES
eukprot:4085877-Amphidinium_carterae.1